MNKLPGLLGFEYASSLLCKQRSLACLVSNFRSSATPCNVNFPLPPKKSPKAPPFIPSGTQQMSLRTLFCEELSSLSPRDPWLQLLFKLSLRSPNSTFKSPSPLSQLPPPQSRAVSWSDLTQQENKNKMNNSPRPPTKPKQNSPASERNQRARLPGPGALLEPLIAPASPPGCSLPVAGRACSQRA